jgi:hypothetical protein
MPGFGKGEQGVRRSALEQHVWRDTGETTSRIEQSADRITRIEQQQWMGGVLQHVGFTNVKVYDSSWLGYGNTLDAPANNVTFFNVGRLNSRLSALQERVNQLEKELAEAKARK